MANVTYPSIQDEELSLSTLLAGVIALLVVAIAVVCSLIAIVWFLRLKHSRSLQISTNLNIRFSSYNRNIVSQGSTRQSGSTKCKDTTVTDQTQNSVCTGSGIHNPRRFLPSISSPILQGSRDKLCSNESLTSVEPTSPTGTPARESTPERPSSYMRSNPMYSSTNFAAGHFLDEVDSGFGGVGQHSDSNLESIYDFPNELSFSSSLVHSYASICDDLITRVRSSDLEHIEVEASHIREIRILGEGQFGLVVLAETVGQRIKDLVLKNNTCNSVVTKGSSTSSSVQVAVKKLKPGADKEVRRAFEKETKLMMQLNHENIVCLLGVCQGEHGFIVMEYMENGDLNQYLKKHSINLQSFNTVDNGVAMDTCSAQISVPTLIFISLQIARGMEYLSSLHFIHRDLATRNCLVGADNIVKISDFGLSRSLYGSYCYKIKGCAVLPIRWMASECFYGKFSEKSDVWAFGVTVWEIFMLARRQPYDTMQNPEFIQDAMKGSERKLLSRPRYCPIEVYRDIMLRCWRFEPEKRADFSELRRILEQTMK